MIINFCFVSQGRRKDLRGIRRQAEADSTQLPVQFWVMASTCLDLQWPTCLSPHNAYVCEHTEGQNLHVQISQNKILQPPQAVKLLVCFMFYAGALKLSFARCRRIIQTQLSF